MALEANKVTGILTLIPGGLNGYSGGNRRTPWYSPPAKGESGGPRYRQGRKHKVTGGPLWGEWWRTIRKFPEETSNISFLEHKSNIVKHAQVKIFFSSGIAQTYGGGSCCMATNSLES